MLAIILGGTALVAGNVGSMWDATHPEPRCYAKYDYTQCAEDLENYLANADVVSSLPTPSATHTTNTIPAPPNA